MTLDLQCIQVADGRHAEALETLDLILRSSADGSDTPRTDSPSPSPTPTRGIFKSRVIASMQNLYTSLSFALGQYSSVQKRMHREDTYHMQRSAAAELTEVGRMSESLGVGFVPMKALPLPSAEALAFLVASMEHIASVHGMYIQGEFYLELLRAVVLENQPRLAKRLLHLKDAGRVRLSKAEDQDRATPIEALARKILNGQQPVEVKR